MKTNKRLINIRRLQQQLQIQEKSMLKINFWKRDTNNINLDLIGMLNDLNFNSILNKLNKIQVKRTQSQSKFCSI
ncbi:unnamed protein product [Paramecium sonneborni]|uniref:Uncharacterized protein n=1 Tax=Paramecium sonneborni TaxID=65129 RepID=A0A8S1R1I2_9CILI|nr:unnamed protein product [Paramecium sonneborni]